MRKNNSIIAKGIPVSRGQVTGPVKIVKNPTEVKKVGQGDIMVVSHSSPAFAIGVMNAAGLICEKGGIMTHICIVAKELGIPCLARVENAAHRLQENMEITIDATQGIIYE
jgi:pyruvate,water dikinase